VRCPSAWTDGHVSVASGGYDAATAADVATAADAVDEDDWLGGSWLELGIAD